MTRLLRGLYIVWVVLRHGLDELVLSSFQRPGIRLLTRVVSVGRNLDAPRGQRLREALERLGPIFVKFGQVLSTRRDLLPPDIADELAHLQDRVPPFDSTIAVATIERAFGKPLDEVFSHFDHTPVASASIAQVHFATLRGGRHGGREVAVKVLRPNMLPVIEKGPEPDAHDGGLGRETVGRRQAPEAAGGGLRVRQVPARRAGPAARSGQCRPAAPQHGRSGPGADSRNVLGLLPHRSDGDGAHDRCADQPGRRTAQPGRRHPKLARDGVTIFFTQVFRDGFFHADMHPGNIQVSLDPATFGRYISLDFGIVGTLTEFDKEYLAQNFTAFFRRDYKRVAELHIESGWVPQDTRVDELESAIRAVCEPYFDRPLKEISLGMVLMRLFQTSRRFHVEIQPQLVLLQKTLLNIEGLGRELDPELDLWATAKPFLEKWMVEQVGPQKLLQQLKAEAPQYAKLLPALPRLMHDYLQHRPHQLRAELDQLLTEQRRTNKLLQGIVYGGIGFVLGLIVTQVLLRIRLW